MPTIKTASSFMKAQGNAGVATILGSSAVLFFMLALVKDGFWQKVLGVIWFVALAATLFKLMHRMGKAFRCPDCGGPVSGILKTDDKPGTPLLRHCQQCDVLWKVGTEPD